MEKEVDFILMPTHSKHYEIHETNYDLIGFAHDVKHCSEKKVKLIQKNRTDHKQKTRSRLIPKQKK